MVERDHIARAMELHYGLGISWKRLAKLMSWPNVRQSVYDQLYSDNNGVVHDNSTKLATARQRARILRTTCTVRSFRPAATVPTHHAT